MRILCEDCYKFKAELSSKIPTEKTPTAILTKIPGERSI